MINVLLYDRTSTCSTVNETRKGLFTRKGRMTDSIPPTKDALWNHLKRAVTAVISYEFSPIAPASFTQHIPHNDPLL